MEQERKKQPQRDSRGAQAAQRRREIREENIRLQHLREKQRRKAKKRSGKPVNKGLYKRLAIMGGVVLAVVLSMILFFRVQHIEIHGTQYYSAEEIAEVAGVAEGDNMLTLSRAEIAGNIRAAKKFVDSVKVTRRLPNTLIITVTEHDPTYAVCDTLGDYYLITAQGVAMEKIPAKQISQYVLITELTIQTPSLGEDISVYHEAGTETLAKGQLSALKALLTAIEDAELGRQIASVSVPSAFKLSVQYGDRFTVSLGNTERLDYKLEYLKAVIAERKSYETGVIDLTLDGGDEARVLLDE